MRYLILQQIYASHVLVERYLALMANLVLHVLQARIIVR